MPVISEYNAPQLDIRPSEIGVESTAAAGRRLGVYGSQIAASKEQVGRETEGAVKSVGDQALQVGEHMEIAAGARHGASLMASATQGLNAYMSGDDIPDDPNDPNAKKAALDQRLNNPKAAQQWIDQKLEPSLEQFQSGFLTEGGQQYAQRFTAELRSHMTTAAMADQSTAAGIAMKDNLQKTADGYATAAFNSHNLHDVTGYINAFDHAIGAISSTSPTINADGQARIKEWAEQEKAKIVTSAVQGRILAGGSYTDITNAYPQYVQPGQNAQFEKQQAFYAKSAEVAQKQTMLLNKQIAEANTQTAINQSFAKNVHIDSQTGAVTIDPQFATDMGKLPINNPNDPNAATHAKTWLDWNEAQHKPPPVADNQPIVDSTLATISDPKVSIDDAKIAIAKAEIAKGITNQTATQLRQLATDMRNLNDPVLTKTMETAKAIISPSMGAAGQMNPAGYQQFYYDFIHNQYLPAKVAGKLPPDALDMKNPDSMISKAISAAQPDVAAVTHANGGVGAPLPVYTAPAKPAAPAALPVGTERTFQGTTYKYKGGNQSDKANWEPVS
jgi:hypothetical protein